MPEMSGARRLCHRITIGVAALGLAVAGLAACSSASSDQPSTSPTAVVATTNQQDAIFASQLIELSEQLVTVTDILDAKTDSGQVSAKIDQLSRTANERIVLAKGWLKLWGRTAVQAPPAPGLLSEKQQDALIDSSGAALVEAISSAAASQLEGTLAISQAETAGGENSSAKQVAQKLAEQSKSELSVLSLVKTSS